MSKRRNALSLKEEFDILERGEKHCEASQEHTITSWQANYTRSSTASLKLPPENSNNGSRSEGGMSRRILVHWRLLLTAWMFCADFRNGDVSVKILSKVLLRQFFFWRKICPGSIPKKIVRFWCVLLRSLLSFQVCCPYSVQTGLPYTIIQTFTSLQKVFARTLIEKKKSANANFFWACLSGRYSADRL